MTAELDWKLANETLPQIANNYICVLKSKKHTDVYADVAYFDVQTNNWNIWNNFSYDVIAWAEISSLYDSSNIGTAFTFDRMGNFYITPRITEQGIVFFFLIPSSLGCIRCSNPGGFTAVKGVSFSEYYNTKSLYNTGYGKWEFEQSINALNDFYTKVYANEKFKAYGKVNINDKDLFKIWGLNEYEDYNSNELSFEIREKDGLTLCRNFYVPRKVFLQELSSLQRKYGKIDITDVTEVRIF